MTSWIVVDRPFFLSPLPLNEFIGKQFGLLIAFVLPGFMTLWGARPLSATIDGWLSISPSLPGGIEAMAFITLASIAAGMTISAARWLIVDSIHSMTGLPRPTWDDEKLQSNLGAFDVIVEAHYRHYLFYANSAVAVAIAYMARVTTTANIDAVHPITASVIAVEILFFLASRDTLRKYYARSSRLLGTVPHQERSVHNGQRQ